MKTFLVPPPQGVADRYSPVVMTASALAAIASSRPVLERCIAIQRGLEPDSYTRWIADLVERGLSLGGDRWGYLDILSVLHAAAITGRPRNYLEVGVRRGRSMAAVVAGASDVDVVGFDLWQVDYGGSPNPGPLLVRQELEKFGHRGSTTFVAGDSRVTVPDWLRSHADTSFDLITVDGDHSLPGAWADLRNVAPRLAVGGVLVFDDVANPYCPGLLELWREFVARDGGLAAHEFCDVGSGVAFAIRTRPGGEVPRRRRWWSCRGS